MLKISRPLVALIAALALLLAGCGSGGARETAEAKPGQLTIVTAFYPFQFVAERVAGSHAVVQTLTKPGAEPHDLELTPRQVGSISSADLVVYEKSFQAAVDEAVEQSTNKNVFDTSTVVPLEKTGAAHDHAADKKAPADHDHGALDPHVWLDPHNVATIADGVAQKLSAVDPEHAADYDKNVTALTNELGDLDQDFEKGLATCDRREFITTHAAFGYLAQRYHLTQIGISGLSPDAEPSPARIAEIHAEAKEHGINTIFYETLTSPAVAKSIADDLKLKTAVLDPIEGITADSAGKDYVAVMMANLSALKAANGCR